LPGWLDTAAALVLLIALRHMGPSLRQLRGLPHYPPAWLGGFIGAPFVLLVASSVDQIQSDLGLSSAGAAVLQAWSSVCLILVGLVALSSAWLGLPPMHSSVQGGRFRSAGSRSEEHTSELQSRED